MRSGLNLLLILSCSLSAVASAQWLPPVQWGEPQVVNLEQGGSAPTADPAHGGVVPAERYPEPLYQDELEALAERAAAATMVVRARFRRDPLLVPPVIEIEGVATALRGADGRTVWVTALILVDGAEAVTFDGPQGPISATVQSDARFGLATLTPVSPLPGATEPLMLSSAAADCHEQVTTAGNTQIGATMGAGEAQYGFYQVSTLPVILGYPLVDRNGTLLGIGSHYYPLNPAFSLAVPAQAVSAFLTGLDSE